MKKETKRKVYLGLWIVTGIMLGIIIGGVCELIYLKLGYATTPYFLAVYVWWVIFGLIFALWAGPAAWQKIYVEGARGKKYIAK